MHLEVLFLNASRRHCEEAEEFASVEASRLRIYEATVEMEVTQERQVLRDSARYWEAEVRRLEEPASEGLGEMDVD